VRTNKTALQAETRTVSIEAPRSNVVRFLGNANNLPRWAPNFARTVRPQNGRWLINAGEGEAEILVAASEGLGTVDLVSAADPTRGAFLRVLPSGAGCELLFTLFFPPTASDAVVTQQMSVVRQELETVKAICESEIAARDAA